MLSFNIFKVNPLDLLMLYIAILGLFVSIIEFYPLKLLAEKNFLPEDSFEEKRHILRIVLLCAIIAVYFLKILAEILPEDYFEE